MSSFVSIKTEVIPRRMKREQKRIFRIKSCISVYYKQFPKKLVLNLSDPQMDTNNLEKQSILDEVKKEIQTQKLILNHFQIGMS